MEQLVHAAMQLLPPQLSVPVAIQHQTPPRQQLGDALLALFAHQPPPETLLTATDAIFALEAKSNRVTVTAHDLRQQQRQHSTNPARQASLETKGSPHETTSTSLHHLPSPPQTQLCVWKGDITQLKLDAVVNAANTQGLGCFQPTHKCIDSVLHRAAGPRLREACRVALQARPNKELTPGGPPILTPGFFLPAAHVLHVVGPHIQPGQKPNRHEAAQLAACYQSCLDAAHQNQFTSIAFCCISTGLFGYPKQAAAQLAIKTVQVWLAAHPTSSLELIVFDVFTDDDWMAYTTHITKSFPDTILAAAHWLHHADTILVVAGAGMSVVEGEMVYVNATDFAKKYPDMPKRGISTAYEAMGLLSDSDVPYAVKWGFWARHMNNMRWTSTVAPSYDVLRRIIGKKNYFILTSNVDGAFERAGFDRDRIYRPQGDWEFVQCVGMDGRKPCRPGAVWPSRSLLDTLLPLVDQQTGAIKPAERAPRCQHCGGMLFGNVRGGGWYLHSPYVEEHARLMMWSKKVRERGDAKVVVLEVGAGFNTPTVTRFPAEAFTRELDALARRRRGGSAALVRVNPSDAEVPVDLRAAVGIREGWDVLHVVEGLGVVGTKEAAERVEGRRRELPTAAGVDCGSEGDRPYPLWMRFRDQVGHFEWDQFVNALKR